MTTFYDVIKITSPKIHHQNNVTKISHLQAPLLAKSCLRSWPTHTTYTPYSNRIVA